ncbi:MAG: alpha/beta hydrolase [Actinomycetota bacterium]|nr:alpha/beta hydrolase [Actinomycetota bacterium]
MRVWRAGSGPPLLAVHGLGGSGRYWQGLVDRLGDRYTVIAPDLPGFGASDAPEGDVDRTMLLGDLDAVVAALAPATIVRLAGHSLGGVLAALWASSHRDRIDGLAMAASPFPDPSAMDLRTRADQRPSYGRRAAARAARTVWPALAVPIGLARGYPIDVVADFGRQSVRARAWTMWSLWSDPDLGREIDSLSALDGSVAMLIAHARDDRTVSVRASDAWSTALPHAEHRVLERGGHQFLLRSAFEPLVGWLARNPAEG